METFSTSNNPGPGITPGVTDTPANTGATSTAPSSSTPASTTPAAGANPSAPTTGQPDQTQNQPQATAPQGQPKQPDLSKSPQVTPAASGQPEQTPQQQRQIQNAGHFYKVAEALAGGPRFKTTIDANTGEAKREPVPLSRGDIGMAIAMEAVSGALSGLGEKGPTATGQAAADGFKQGQQQAKDAQQQQEQQAQQDFARHAQVFDTNMRMYQAAQTIGQKDYDTNVEYAAQYKPLADQIQKDYPQFVKGVGGESDITKYHFAKDMAIPTGNVIPVFDSNTGKQAEGPYGNKLWQQEYLFIDPNFKGDNFLTDADKAEAVKFHLPGFVDSDGKASNLPQNISMKIGMAMSYKNKIANLKLGEDNVQDFYKKVGTDSPNLVDMVKQDPTLPDAMQKFQPLLMATDGNYTKAIGELAQGGNGRQPDPNAAGKILNLYGGAAMVQKYDQQVSDEKEQQKKEADKQAQFAVIDTQAKADAVLADPKSFKPEQIAAAKAFSAIQTKHDVSEAGAKGYAEGAAHAQAEIDVKNKNGIPLTSGGGGVAGTVKDPAVQAIQFDPNEQPVNGIRQGYFSRLKETSPQLADLVQSLGEGRTVMSNYGLARGDGQLLAAILTRAYPDYDQSKAPAYQHTRQSFTSGKDSKQIESMNTTMMHGNRAFQSAGNESVLIPGTQANADYSADVEQLKEEINSAYTDGVLKKDKADEMSSKLTSPFPWVRKANIKEVMNLLGDKATQKQRTWQRAKPSSAIPDMAIITPEAQSDFKSVTGLSIDQYGIVGGGARSGQSGAVEMPKGATGKAKASDGKWYYHDASGNNLGPVAGQ